MVTVFFPATPGSEMEGEDRDGCVLEADLDAGEAGPGGPARRRPSEDGELRIERQIQLEAEQAQETDDSVFSPLRALRAADELGQEAERGLEAELARELGLEGGARAPGTGAPDEDPYERQLEGELEDHLCNLRVEEPPPHGE
ncbi:unnamed protein product, partial [Prorocentrum cordatum]